MKRAGIIIIWVVRAIFLVIAVWQILGLLPVFSWLSNPAGVTAGMWMVVIVKLVVMLVCFGVYRGLGKLIERITKSLQVSNAIAPSADSR